MMLTKKLILATLLLALVAPTVPADVLVMKDGARVETKGEWRVEGRQVVFTLPNGTLSAIRASEVDLDASRAATSQAAAPPAAAAPPPPPRQAVLVLTNDDLPEVVETADASETSGALPSPQDREPVQVTDWRRTDTGEGIEIRGNLRNVGRSMATNISLSLQVKDEEGTVVDSATAFLTSTSLLAGSSTTFRAVLAAVDDFTGEPVFEVDSSAVTLGGASFAPGQQASEAEEESDDGGSDAAGSDDAFEGSGDSADEGAPDFTGGDTTGEDGEIDEGEEGFEESDSAGSDQGVTVGYEDPYEESEVDRGG